MKNWGAGGGKTIKFPKKDLEVSRAKPSTECMKEKHTKKGGDRRRGCSPRPVKIKTKKVVAENREGNCRRTWGGGGDQRGVVLRGMIVGRPGGKGPSGAVLQSSKRSAWEETRSGRECDGPL